jgi:peptide deformylase
MTVRLIHVDGDPVLHRPTRPAVVFGPYLRSLAEDMFETMYAAQGVGLAANQIGVDLRMFVYDCPDGDGVWHAGAMVNARLAEPVVGQEPVESEVGPEGCLSVPQQTFPTRRAMTARIVGTDLAGSPVDIEATGLLARCFQHEVDHLDGRLHLDHLSEEEAEQARRVLRSGWETGTDGSWLPALPEGFTGPITRDMPLPSGDSRGPLATGGNWAADDDQSRRIDSC